MFPETITEFKIGSCVEWVDHTLTERRGVVHLMSDPLDHPAIRGQVLVKCDEGVYYSEFLHELFPCEV